MLIFGILPHSLFHWHSPLCDAEFLRFFFIDAVYYGAPTLCLFFFFINASHYSASSWCWVFVFIGIVPL